MTFLSKGCGTEDKSRACLRVMMSFFIVAKRSNWLNMHKKATLREDFQKSLSLCQCRSWDEGDFFFTHGR